jgi:integrase
VPGHLVRTQPTGKQDFYYCYRRPGDRRQQYVHIGPIAIGLATSRDVALRLAAEVAAGGDPAARRRQARAEAKARRTSGADDLERYRRFDAYLTEIYARHVEAEQVRGAETVARLKAAFANFLPLDLAEITSQRVRDWRADRLKAGIARTTIDRDVGVLKTLLTHAVKVTQLLSDNPLREVRPLTKGAERLNSTRFANEDEEARLRSTLQARDARMRTERARTNAWNAARSRPTLSPYPEHFVDHLEPMVLVLLNTGLRFGELTHLRWSAVDFRARMLTVDGAGAKSRVTRHVPMPDEAIAVLSRWRTRTHAGTHDLVFPGAHNRPLVDIKSAWSRLLRDAGITRLRIHDLRHSFASRLVQRGVSLFAVQQLLGHASPAMTQRYAHLAGSHLAAAVAVLDRPRPQRVAGSAAD